MEEAYPDKITEAISIFPSAKVSDNVLEAYNATLAVKPLVKSADMGITFDNEALLSLCHERLKIKKPTYSDLNSLVSTAMCGITASTRFPGQLNTSLRVDWHDYLAKPLAEVRRELGLEAAGAYSIFEMADAPGAPAEETS